MALPAWQAGRLTVWATLSVGLSLYNKWLLGRLAFNFPVSLSFVHMAGATLVLNTYVWRHHVAHGSGHGQHRAVATADAQAVLEAGGPCRAYSKGPATIQLVPRFWLLARSGKAGAPSPPGGTPAGRGWAQEQAWWLRRHARHLVPIAALFAASVCLRNSAFAGLPLPVMQLLGSCAPLGTYALSAAVGFAALTLPGLASVTACILGVAIAISDHLVPFSVPALARHGAGLGLEVCRCILLQLLIREIEAFKRPESAGVMADEAGTAADILTSSSGKMSRPAPSVGVLAHPSAQAPASPAPSGQTPPAPPAHSSRTQVPLPTTLLAVYSPLCAAMLAIPAAAFEARPAVVDAAGRPSWFWFAVAGNVVVALAHNLASVSCLQHVSVMAMSLTGFAKDWSVVVLSTVLFGREVTPRFVTGMAVVAAAVIAYSHCRRG